jgi:signal transduction histidine kinase
MHTPLHAILGFGEIAADAVEQQDQETVREAIGRIRDKGAEMAGHVESLLQLSRLTLGRERAHPTQVDVPALLGRCVESARLAAASAFDFRLHVAPDVATAFVDGEKLERIVGCLLSNATKFSERGTVEVDATVEPNGSPDTHVLHLSVRDQGIGLDSQTAKRAFDDFRQGDGSLTRRYPGLGLGLSISRRLASLLGGSVQVESERGRGAKFDLRVPVS